MTCETCPFSVLTTERYCRRFPPTIVVDPVHVSGYTNNDDEHHIETTIAAYWPEVDNDGWCGEHPERKR